MEHPAPEFAQRQHFEAQPLGPWTNNREPPGDYIRAIGRDVALFTQNNRVCVRWEVTEREPTAFVRCGLVIPVVWRSEPDRNASYPRVLIESVTVPPSVGCAASSGLNTLNTRANLQVIPHRRNSEYISDSSRGDF